MRSRAFLCGTAFILAAFLFASSVPVGAEEIKEIDHLFPGITRIHIQSTRLPESDPRPLNINILEVDVDDDHIRFFVTPGNGDDPLEYTAQTTTDFVSTWGVQVAVNGDFWNTTTAFDGYREVMSLAVSNGVKYSDPGCLPTPAFPENYLRTGLTFTQEGEAYIGRWDDIWDPDTMTLPELGQLLLDSGVYNAVGGNKMLVYEGEVHSDAYFGGAALARRARTSVGLSEDGKMLILAVVDGRLSGFSEGVGLAEMGELLIEWGAYTAMNLDGGGSSSMVIEGVGRVNFAEGAPERSVANHLGIFVVYGDDDDDDDDDEGSSKSVAPVPGDFSLSQNNPNPFNPVTTIAYDLPEASDVTLTLYTITGQQVATLVSGHQEAGHYEVTWDASGFGDGVYLYRLEAGDFVETRRMVLLK